jgi:hypothetical protein
MNNKKTAAWLIGLALAAAPAMTLYGQDGPPPPPPPGAWQPQEPPGSWSQIWHQGFHEGVEAARHDIQSGRPADPDHHESFRHPNVPPDQRHDFREGFRRGYQAFLEHQGSR